MMFPLIHGLFVSLSEAAVDLNYKGLMARLGAWAYWPLDESAVGNDTSVATKQVLVDLSGYGRNGSYDVVYSLPANGGQQVTYTQTPNSSIPYNTLMTYTLAANTGFTVAAIRVHVEMEDTQSSILNIEFDGGGDGFSILFNEKSIGAPELTQWFTSHISKDKPDEIHVGHFDYNIIGISPAGNMQLYVKDIYGNGAVLKSWSVVLYDATAAANLQVQPLMDTPDVVLPLTHNDEAHTRQIVVKNETPNVSLYRNSPLDYSYSFLVGEDINIAGIRVYLDLYYPYQLDELKVSLVRGATVVPLHNYIYEDEENLRLVYVSDAQLGGDRTVAGLTVFNGSSSQGMWSLRFENSTNYDVTGAFNQAIIEFLDAFDPSTEYAKGFNGSKGITLATPAAPLLESDALPVKEIEVWAKFNDLVADQVIYREGDNTNGWAFGIVGQYLSVGVAQNGVIKRANFSTSTLDTTGKHLISGLVNVTEDTLKLFVGGVQVASESAVGLSAHNSAVGAMLGTSYDPVSGQHFFPLTGATSNKGFDGILDNVAVYKYERTPKERGWVKQVGITGVAKVPVFDPYDMAIYHLGADVHYPVNVTNATDPMLNLGTAPNSNGSFSNYGEPPLGVDLPGILGMGKSVQTSEAAHFRTEFDSTNVAITADDTFTYVFGFAASQINLDGYVIVDFYTPAIWSSESNRCYLRVGPDGKLLFQAGGVEQALDDLRDWRIDTTAHLFCILGEFDGSINKWVTSVYMDNVLLGTIYSSKTPPN